MRNNFSDSKFSNEVCFIKHQFQFTISSKNITQSIFGHQKKPQHLKAF